MNLSRTTLAAALLLAGLPCLTATAAPEIASMRLLDVGKDAATLRLELTEADVASVSWGEQPGDWLGSAVATEAAESHELNLTGLAPTRRYFYQVEIAGIPQGDIATFISGRSWVTRQATILVAAATPSGRPEDQVLADALFAREADALVMLGGEGDAEAFRALHRRALADRVVSSGPDSPQASIPVSDVLLSWKAAADIEADAARQGACWRVALAAPSDTADVVLRGGEASALSRNGEQLVATIAGHDWLELGFVSGTLTATLRGASGTLEERIERTCTVPKPAASDLPGMDEIQDDPDGGLGSDCDLP